jgi:cob(I)alamin adenosyltransferase
VHVCPRHTCLPHAQRVAFGEGHSEQLEGWIDGMMEELPPLTQFILPSGGCGQCPGSGGCACRFGVSC